MIDQIKTCTLCELISTCQQPIVGEGSTDATIMVVGEAPGKNEDLQGRPFIGRSGQLLNELLAEVGLEREQVYITNIVKCRPPSNRNPEVEEVDACFPYLRTQIELIRPKVIIALGTFAAQVLTGKQESITRLRGRAFELHDFVVVPAFHPAYILRNRVKKPLLKQDIEMAHKLSTAVGD